MSYQVQIRESARRDLAALPLRDRQRIAQRIDALAQNPRPHGCLKLSGPSNLWRIRVGVYRIIYQIQDDRLIVQVIEVAHRREVYRRL